MVYDNTYLLTYLGDSEIVVDPQHTATCLVCPGQFKLVQGNELVPISGINGIWMRSWTKTETSKLQPAGCCGGLIMVSVKVRVRIRVTAAYRVNRLQISHNWSNTWPRTCGLEEPSSVTWRASTVGDWAF